MAHESGNVRHNESGLPVEPVYGPEALEGWDPERSLGVPGSYPFTRGVYPSMYTGRPWTMRQYAGFGTARESNARYRQLIAHGTTGLSVAFDLPTQMGHDSDTPIASGEVGKVGVAIDSVEDMRVLFGGIPLDKVSTSMTINAPAALLLLLYQLVGEEEGVAAGQLNGTVQNDVLKEYIARDLHLPAAAVAAADRGHLPVLPGRDPPVEHHLHLRLPHGGGGRLARAGDRLHARQRHRLCAYRCCRRDGRRRLRAAAVLLLRRADDAARRGRQVPGRATDLGPGDAGGVRREEPQVADAAVPHPDGGVQLTAQQPEVNLARVTLQGLAAVLGGTQSLHTNSFDEAIALPTDKSARLALRTQQVLAYETDVTATVDPFAGSYAVESMTDEAEEAAVALMRRVEDMGGAVAAIERGFQKEEIERNAYRIAQETDAGERVVVGVNRFQLDEEEPYEPLRVDPAIEAQQIERLAVLRDRRNARAVSAALGDLRKAAEGTDNVLYPMREALRARATVGEVCDALREVWGTYVPTDAF